jgi:hypothetical protein
MDDLASAAEVKRRPIPAYWIIGIFIFVNTMICCFDRVSFSVVAPTIIMFLTAPKALDAGEREARQAR